MTLYNLYWRGLVGEVKILQIYESQKERYQISKVTFYILYGWSIDKDHDS